MKKKNANNSDKTNANQNGGNLNLRFIIDKIQICIT